MGKGLSRLQNDVLAALDDYPVLEEIPKGTVSIAAWARPKDILIALGRAPTPSHRASLSKALDRLCQRGLIYAASGQLASVGRGFRYVMIKRPDKARSGTT